MSRVKAASSPASPPLTSGSVGVMVEKRRCRSDRYRLIPVSAVYTRGERLHKIRDRPKKLSPVNGSTAPNAYRCSRICWQGTEGRIPSGHQQGLGLLILPNPASSSNISRTFRFGSRFWASSTEVLIFLRLRMPLHLLPLGAWNAAFSCSNCSVPASCTHMLVLCLSHMLRPALL